MPQSHVTLEHRGPVAIVTLNRPEKRNAVTTEMIKDLERISRSFADDENSRVVVFRAAGRDFSVGFDLALHRQVETSPTLLMRRRSMELGARLMRALQEIHQPTICAVQGIATGGGACIASACDFRVAAEDVRIGYGEVKLGMNLMWNAVPICVHLIGPARAKRMIMSGNLFDASTLERWGFLDEVVPTSQLESTAVEMGNQFASLPPISVQMIKRSINAISGALDPAIMHMDTDQWLLASATHDSKEAIEAFFEKRKPNFTGN
jgi:enoyl-CoA hydratase/carnithine racemase